ncbi:MAG: HAD-IA family hydrolase [Spirochaetes bacterium]|nr:HAD-IA family hydrolase [Spirochaetota bacterium]
MEGLSPGAAASGIREEVLLVLKILGLAAMFDPAVTSTDVQRAKPARDLYLRAAEALGVPPDEYAVIEDYEHGTGAADAAAARLTIPPLEPFPGSLATGCP